MTVPSAILVIGDEILSGKTDDLTRLLISELRELGVALRTSWSFPTLKT
jgi:molybdopterin-biosynthesis enzyme MoeA-like protein